MSAAPSAATPTNLNQKRAVYASIFVAANMERCQRDVRDFLFAQGGSLKQRHRLRWHCSQGKSCNTEDGQSLRWFLSFRSLLCSRHNMLLTQHRFVQFV
jgi:hypothetical protein